LKEEELVSDEKNDLFILEGSHLEVYANYFGSFVKGL
jgi:hypothetical protein